MPLRPSRNLGLFTVFRGNGGLAYTPQGLIKIRGLGSVLGGDGRRWDARLGKLRLRFEPLIYSLNLHPLFTQPFGVIVFHFFKFMYYIYKIYWYNLHMYENIINIMYFLQLVIFWEKNNCILLYLYLLNFFQLHIYVLLYIIFHIYIYYISYIYIYYISYIYIYYISYIYIYWLFWDITNHQKYNLIYIIFNIYYIFWTLLYWGI